MSTWIVFYLDIEKIMNFLFTIYSSVADNKDFHTASAEYDQPYLYCTLTQPGDKVRNIFSILY